MAVFNTKTNSCCVEHLRGSDNLPILLPNTICATEQANKHNCWQLNKPLPPFHVNIFLFFSSNSSLSPWSTDVYDDGVEDMSRKLAQKSVQFIINFTLKRRRGVVFLES